MFAEAVFQLHLNFLLIGMLVTKEADRFTIWTNDGMNWSAGLGDNKWLIWASFSISVSSAIFGLTKFLKTGPVKIVNHGSEIGRIGPLVGFGITMILISSFMISKAAWVLLNTGGYGNGNYSFTQIY